MKVFASLFFFLFLSIALPAQTKDECLACHSDNSLTMEKKGKTISLFVDEKHLDSSPHKKFSCTTCHTGFDPNNVPHKENITPVQCQTCHTKNIAKHTFHKTVVSDGADKSKMCKECHGKHDVVSPKIPGSKFYSSNIVNACGTCHDSEKEKFLKSAHGVSFASNDKNAPNCLKCHSVLMPTNGAQKDSVTVKLVQVKMCISCHSKQTSSTGTTSNFVMSYEESVHGKALKNGNSKVAICSDCHGSHDMQKGNNLSSKVNKTNIPNTCGQCHADVEKVYKKSIHGTAFIKGNESAPVCTNCHGEHRILAPKDPNSPVSKLHVSVEVCSPCHSSVKMSEKFGLPTGRSKSFFDSYHGLAEKGGSKEAANCASCHGFHEILPSSDPKSKVSKANLAITCGKCHPGANENFSKGSIHVTTKADSEDSLIGFVSSVYIMLIVVTIGVMGLHNILDFFKKSTRKLRHRRHGNYEEEIGHGLYVRMTLSERFQHGSFALSFIILVITGFMLRYPDAWWVVSIRSITPGFFEIRSWVHRISAVVMLTAGFYHLYYIFFVPRGKQLIFDLLPKFSDLIDALNVAKYNLGISKEKPRLDRFSYIEKAEYWALIWGTMVMAATGFILWFDNTFLNILGKQYWDVARVVHYYEAWLATLAIIVWHFYFVIFNPDIYPMNLAWIKGTLSEEEMADEHPLELKRLKEEELMKAENKNEPEK